jgi:hypothetical protein
MLCALRMRTQRVQGKSWGKTIGQLPGKTHDNCLILVGRDGFEPSTSGLKDLPSK